MTNNPPKSKFEIIVDLIKALLWPTIVICVLIIFWGPLRLIADQIPSIVSRSESITISGLSIKIRNNDVVEKPSDSVRMVLAKLSPNGVKRMLNNSTAVYWDKGQESYGKEDYGELIKLGLYREVTPDELRERNTNNKNYGFGAERTPLGEETNNFLIQLVAGFVDELNGPKNKT